MTLLRSQKSISASLIEVEVAYASATRQWLISVRLPEGATVSDAIAAANLKGLPVQNLPELEGNVGIFARSCQLSDVLKTGDRVEIYRPLIADPMAQRRNRAVVAKKLSVKNAAINKR